MSALTLKKNPPLRDFQAYVAELVKERGFEKETVPELFMLLMEECGELAKAARKALKMYMDKSKRGEGLHLAHDAADVFIYLLDICNHFGIDLEQAFREKEEVNKRRVWG